MDAIGPGPIKTRFFTDNNLFISLNVQCSSWLRIDKKGVETAVERGEN